MQNKFKKLLPLIIGLVGGLFSTTSHAHVKWFVDTETAAIAGFQAYSFFDAPVLFWLVAGIIIIAIAIFLDTKLVVPKAVDTIVSNTKNRHDVMEILRVFTGISFLLTSYNGSLIAPHLVATDGLGLTLVFIQALIGIILMSNRFIEYAAALMVIVLLSMITKFGALSVLEYINVLGIALFLLFNNFSSRKLLERYKPYSVDALRILTGLALIVLGLSEKIYGAVYGQEFLQSYAWNFMPFFGFESFSDRLFVLSVGAVEIILGIIIMLGVITRITTITIAGFMLTSNLVFILQGESENALTELVGHLPIIGTALVFIMLGYGQRLKVTNYIGKKS